MKFKKVICMLLLFAVVLGGNVPETFAMVAENLGTVGQTADEAAVARLAVNYITEYVNAAYLYEESNLTVDTLLEQMSESTIQAAEADSTTIMLYDTSYTVAELSENIQQFEDVANYFKVTRSAQEIERYNFSFVPVVNSVVVDGSVAYVELYTEISFQYEEGGETAVFGDNYEVQFIKVVDTWCIANVISEEMVSLGLEKEEFDCDAALTQFFATQQTTRSSVSDDNGVLAEPVTGVEILGTTSGDTVLNKRAYNRNNAVSYAYTYTTSTYTAASGNDSDFLNEHFSLDMEPYGGNCQNFASQCIWAGFYGNNREADVDAYLSPMDTVGSAAECWYSNGGWGFDSNHNWIACGTFWNYIQTTANSDSPTGILADTYTIAANSNFASIPNAQNQLIGAVLHVQGSGAFGHAIVVTGATGTNYENITFCANSPMRKGADLSEYASFTGNQIRVIIPRYSQVASNCSGHTYATYDMSISPSGSGTVCTKCGYNNLIVYGNMLKPLSRGTTQTIAVGSNYLCLRIAVGITTPSGTTSWYSAERASSTTLSYTFSEAGLYTIQISARDMDSSYADSNTASHVYTVRVYEAG